MRVRFVGGPEHNRLISRSGYIPGDQVRVGEDWYTLKRFITAKGTKYVQFIHESLLGKNGEPAASTYKERFKKWKLGLRGT